MTLTTSGPQVTFIKQQWRVRCPRLQRSFDQFAEFYGRRHGGNLPIVNGRFYARSSGPATLDEAGTRGNGRGTLGGRITSTVATGYFYETVDVLGADGRTVVETCRTGRIGWTLRRIR